MIVPWDAGAREVSMTRFTVVMEAQAPPAYVVAWWTDFQAADAGLTPDVTRRVVQRLDERRTHVVTDLTVQRRRVQLDCVVTLESPTSWRLEGELRWKGRPFAHESTSFSVEPSGAGTRLTAEFHFVGTSLWNGILVALNSGGARRSRVEAYAGYREAINRDFAAGKPPRVPA